eukprot:m.296308 g.296308  ORF g.296308 m.296308 type:complete len:394 (-) comp20056_c0_seq1:134-1315(-)
MVLLQEEHGSASNATANQQESDSTRLVANVDATLLRQLQVLLQTLANVVTDSRSLVERLVTEALSGREVDSTTKTTNTTGVQSCNDSTLKNKQESSVAAGQAASPTIIKQQKRDSRIRDSHIDASTRLPAHDVSQTGPAVRLKPPTRLPMCSTRDNGKLSECAEAYNKGSNEATPLPNKIKEKGTSLASAMRKLFDQTEENPEVLATPPKGSRLHGEPHRVPSIPVQKPKANVPKLSREGAVDKGQCPICSLCSREQRATNCTCKVPPCTTCRSHQAQVQASDGIPWPTCPGSCGIRMNYRDLRQLPLEQSVWTELDKLHRLDQNLLREDISGSIWCSNRACDNLLDVTGPVAICYDIHCGYHTCTIHELPMKRTSLGQQRTCAMCVDEESTC